MSTISSKKISYLHYLSAIGLSALVLVCNSWMDPRLRDGTFFLVIVSVFLTSCTGGIGPTLLMIGLNTIGLSLFFPESAYSLSIREPADVGRIALFLSALGVSAYGGYLLKRFSDRNKLERDLHVALIESDQILDSSNDVKGALSQLSKLYAPYVHWCVFDWLEPNGEVRRLFTHHSDPLKKETVQEFTQVVSDLKGRGGFAKALRENRAILYPTSESMSPVQGGSAFEELMLGATEERQLELIRAFGCESYMTAISKTRKGGTLGVTWVRSGNASPYEEGDLYFIQELATRITALMDRMALQRETQEAIESRDCLLSLITHDFKGPLSALELRSSLVMRGLNSPNTLSPTEVTGLLRHMRGVKQSATRMLRLVNDLLDLSKIESGSLSLKRSPEPIQPIISEILDLIQPLLSQKSLQVIQEIGPDLPQVYCNRERILQVFSNLLGNAIKFTAEGGAITVKAEKQGSLLICSVKDTGVGMPTGHLEKILSQKSFSRDRSGQTAGLGLPLSKAIIELHMGKLWGESRSGEGSTFFFSLPVSEQKVMAMSLLKPEVEQVSV